METQQQADFFTQEVEAYSALDFESLFQEFNEMLNHYAFYFLKDREAAASVVNDIFIKLWKSQIKPTHLKSYLFKSVKNACLNHIEKTKNQEVLKEYDELEAIADQIPEAEYSEELQKKLLFLERVIAELPAKRQQVFKMFRYEGMSYAQIADTLQISVRTVEDHLAKSMQYIHSRAKHLTHQKLTNT